MMLVPPSVAGAASCPRSPPLKSCLRATLDTLLLGFRLRPRALLMAELMALVIAVWIWLLHITDCTSARAHHGLHVHHVLLHGGHVGHAGAVHDPVHGHGVSCSRSRSSCGWSGCCWGSVVRDDCLLDPCLAFPWLVRHCNTHSSLRNDDILNRLFAIGVRIALDGALLPVDNLAGGVVDDGVEAGECGACGVCDVSGFRVSLQCSRGGNDKDKEENLHGGHHAVSPPC